MLRSIGYHSPMTTRETRKRRLSAITGDEWLRISALLALAVSLFLGVFHLLAWGVGMPGPFLWFGSGDRLDDIGIMMFTMFLCFFIFNFIGAICVMSFFALRERFSRRS